MMYTFCPKEKESKVKERKGKYMSELQNVDIMSTFQKKPETVTVSVRVKREDSEPFPEKEEK